MSILSYFICLVFYMQIHAATAQKPDLTKNISAKTDKSQATVAASQNAVAAKPAKAAATIESISEEVRKQKPLFGPGTLEELRTERENLTDKILDEEISAGHLKGSEKEVWKEKIVAHIASQEGNDLDFIELIQTYRI